jgi:very-short-patch-repair endonuclease
MPALNAEHPVARVSLKTLLQARALRRRLTSAETILWSRLRLGLDDMKFRRQHPIEPTLRISPVSARG